MTPDLLLSDPSTDTSSSTLQAIEPQRGYAHLLSLPPTYAQDSGRRWPLMVFLHGTAGWGSNVWNVAVHGLSRLLAQPADLSAAEKGLAAKVAQEFIVVAPQCPYWEVWDERLLIGLLDDVAQHHRIDATRVYLTGLSMGGFGVWSIGLRHPQRFAALVPICGGGRVADVARAAQHHSAALKRLGVWAFHGALDEVVPLEESARMVTALEQAGVAEARLTVYPDAAHDAWTATYANPELYAWLRRFSA